MFGKRLRKGRMNQHLLGIKRFDQVNLRLSFFIIAAFSLITIISYFYELSK